MRTGIKVFQNADGVYILELWGGSTKHPDSVFSMADFHMADWCDPNNPEVVKGQVFQWLLECASKLTFPFHAAQLAEYALENWQVWKD